MSNKRVLKKYDGLKYGWLKDTKKFLVLVLIVFLVFQLIIGISFVKGDSMEPTLHSGELVLYTRMYSNYKRGDVVSVRIPSGEYYVKRVIGIPGDTIEIKDGQVYLNGKLQEEAYIQGETFEQDGVVRYPLTVQEGQIFVMGDNREISMDSRSFGVVGGRQIKGKLLLRAGGFYIEGI